MRNSIATAALASGAAILATTAIAAGLSLGAPEAYDPKIDPADFTTRIDNPYFSLPVGRRLVYEEKTENGLEHIEIVVPGWTRTIMGVQTLVAWYRDTIDGKLIEDVRDYYAQSKNGDVWYFGEHVDAYEDGKLHDHDGTWIAGEDGAKPGIWMTADPQPGDEFRVESYKSEAEDVRKITALDVEAKVPKGAFKECAKTLDWAPHDPGKSESYFCKEIGARALEVDLVGPDTPVEQRLQLFDIGNDGAAGNGVVPEAYAKEGVMVAK